MFQEFLRDTPLIMFPLAAFMLFFATFVGVCIYLAVGKIRRKDLSDVASLPLEEDVVPGRAHGGDVDV